MENKTRSPSWALTTELSQKSRQPLTRLTAYVSIATLVVLLAFSNSVTLYDTVIASGKLVSRDQARILSAATTFTVKEIFVDEFDHVKQGDLLAVAQTQLSENEYRMIAADLTELFQIFDRTNISQCQSCVNTIKRINQSSFRTEHSFPLQSRMSSLVLKLKKWIDLPQARLSLKSEITVEVETLQSELKKFQEDHSIIAPVTGIISKIYPSGAGEVVPQAKPVIEIVPDSNEQLAKLQVRSQDISRIREGMDVRITSRSLPSTQYNPIEGKVESISPDARLNPNNGLIEFPVTVKVLKPSIELKYGTLVQGDILAEPITAFKLATRTITER